MYIEGRIAQLCLKTNSTIAIAESCTGGKISGRITDMPGSSRYFFGGAVTYSNEAKMKLLRVPFEVLEEFGAVSEITAKCMAEGVRSVFGSRIGLSVTGIAGPDGGSPEKPVGLVYIGICDEKECLIKEYIFSGDRAKIRDDAASEALSILKMKLEGFVEN